jgi:hypothetical protein
MKVLLISSEAQRSREWNGWGSRDIDEKTGGKRTGSERIKSLEEKISDVSTPLDMTRTTAEF